MPRAKVALPPAPAGVGPLFERLTRLARNLWWTWNPDGVRLFAAMNPTVWELCNQNPLRVMQMLDGEQRAALAANEHFVGLLTEVERQLATYMKTKTWFERRATAAQKDVRVAYFCAEFSIHESLPIYAGGLGVLAGDHLKSASDLGIPLVGVGLLYRNGYYRQQFERDGATRVIYPSYDYGELPISDTGEIISVPIARRQVFARVWMAEVGRVPLYLLDTDFAKNKAPERAITQRLYGGGPDIRIQQEILLGVGGYLALEQLGHDVTAYHLNEGHAAFCALERLRQLRQRGVPVPAAVREVRQAGVFTTHTPVSAGHDRFPQALMQKYLGPLFQDLGLSVDEWMGLGRENQADRKEPFCMTVLALRLSGRCNGVSQLHGEVSRAMWTRVYETKDPAKVPISHITNGIHTETWLAMEARPFYARWLKPEWVGAGPEDDWWAKVDKIPPAELWRLRTMLRRKLVQFVRHRLVQQVLRNVQPLEEISAALECFDENALTIGFARRFATYKRAPLIFLDTKRLAKILGDPSRPVQLVFAGKAHPADREGQEFAKLIYQKAHDAGLRGRVALLEDYDTNVGRVLTSGADVWLNNPIRPQEASGTSGMKPPLHGGINCSILDGWWPEAYDGKNGWAIGDGKDARGREQQDKRDAEAIYTLLEKHIVPAFYDRGRDGLPQAWIKRIAASMKTVCGRFNAHRMVREYLDMYVG